MKKIIIFSHHTEIPGPSHKWLSYLKRKKYDVDYVFHPLMPSGKLKSEINIRNKKFRFKIMGPLQFMLEGIISAVIIRLKAKDKHYDLAVCFDPFSFLNVYIVKTFYSFKKVAYYNIDYSEKRFKNAILNKIYGKINLFAYRQCDYFFAVTARFIKDIDPGQRLKKQDKCFLVSHTVRPRQLKKKRKFPNSIIYSGTLSEAVDFDSLLKALARLKTGGLPFKFDIYGKDGQESQLRKKIAELQLTEEVSLKGITDYENLADNILPLYMIGVCPYVTDSRGLSSDYLFQADNLTTKMADYISRGLPLVSTRPFPYVEVIEKNKFGILVENEDGWYNAIKNFFNDRILYRLYSERAFKFAKRYDEKKVIGTIMRQIFNNRLK